MNSERIKSKAAPEPIGPYSQAIKLGELVFTSGQIALDPKSGEIAGEDIRTQTRQVLENLRAVLESAGASMDTVVKTTIYLKNMGDFTVVNEVYAEYFSRSLPARSTVEVARLPKDVKIEIECIAALP